MIKVNKEKITSLFNFQDSIAADGGYQGVHTVFDPNSDFSITNNQTKLGPRCMKLIKVLLIIFSTIIGMLPHRKKKNKELQEIPCSDDSGSEFSDDERGQKLKQENAEFGL